jgi:hypothetical protein
MPSVGTLDGLPMLISGAGAWVMFEGYWVPANWGDAAWNGRVLCIEDFLRLFPDLPPWPAEFNPRWSPAVPRPQVLRAPALPPKYLPTGANQRLTNAQGRHRLPKAQSSAVKCEVEEDRGL